MSTIPNAPGTPADRRSGDRRERPTPILSRYWLNGGRRRGGRRDGESRDVYVDAYSPAEWALFASVLAFSYVDLVLTLVHLDAGGEEANPAMRWALAQWGPVGFAVAKMGVTLTGLFVLLLHVRFRRVRTLVGAILAIYAAVLAWHVYLRLFT